MKNPLIIGDIVRFKGSGLGLGKVVSITPQRKGNPLYHVETLDGKALVATGPEFIEKLNPDDSDLVNTLNSVGLL
jgi:hypothetical protein